MTDTGNAARFVEQHQHAARWLTRHQEWRIWDGRRWHAHEKDDAALHLAKLTALAIDDEVAREVDDTKRAVLRKWAVKSQSAAALRAMVALAKADPRLWSQVSEFDADPFLLNFANGTVDLRTGALEQHNPDNRITRILKYDYAPGAVSPLWDKLIARCTLIDPTGQTAAYLQRVLGYMCLGTNPEQKFFLLVGPKRTGKSKVVEILAHLLGDYGWQSQVKLITKQRFGHHESELTSIRGRRFVCISETDAAMDLDEALVKNLSGASYIATRALYKASEEQTPVTWTIIVGTNEEPNIERWDDAIGRRVVKIPSGPSLDESEVDLELESKIVSGEAEGVLASVVAGAVEWFEQSQANGSGLDMPEAVQAATSAFERGNDHVADFIEDQIDFRPEGRVQKARVNDAYKRFRGGGDDALKTRALYTRIMDYCESHGYAVSADGRSFYGMELADGEAGQSWTRVRAMWE